MKQYEVWCSRCQVSFPVGTKRCLHCGERTQKERIVPHSVGAPHYSIDGAPVFGEVGGEPGPLADLQEDRFSVEEEEETPRRRGLRAAMSLVWMLLLAAGYLWQSCQGRG